jgi:hypothetical protein
MRRFPGPIAAALSLALTLPGCAAMFSQAHDDVTIASEPAGAECRIERMSQPVAWVKSTPETVRIARSHYPLDVYCTKDTNAGALSVNSTFDPVAYVDIFPLFVPYMVDSLTDGDRQLPATVVVRFPLSR